MNAYMQNVTHTLLVVYSIIIPIAVLVLVCKITGIVGSIISFTHISDNEDSSYKTLATAALICCLVGLIVPIVGLVGFVLFWITLFKDEIYRRKVVYIVVIFVGLVLGLLIDLAVIKSANKYTEDLYWGAESTLQDASSEHYGSLVALNNGNYRFTDKNGNQAEYDYSDISTVKYYIETVMFGSEPIGSVDAEKYICENCTCSELNNLIEKAKSNSSLYW